MLIASFGWVLYLFAAFLLFTGYRLAVLVLVLIEITDIVFAVDSLPAIAVTESP